MEKQEKILTIEEIETKRGIKQDKLVWYKSVSEEIYKTYPDIRLTDSQLAEIIVKKYGGLKVTHITNIRRTRCNDKTQDYVGKTI